MILNSCPVVFSGGGGGGDSDSRVCDGGRVRVDGGGGGGGVGLRAGGAVDPRPVAGGAFFTADEVRTVLRLELTRWPTQSAFAAAHNLSRPIVSIALMSDGRVSPCVARALGFEREVVYRVAPSGGDA